MKRGLYGLIPIYLILCRVLPVGARRVQLVRRDSATQGDPGRLGETQWDPEGPRETQGDRERLGEPRRGGARRARPTPATIDNHNKLIGLKQQSMFCGVRLFTN